MRVLLFLTILLTAVSLQAKQTTVTGQFDSQIPVTGQDKTPAEEIKATQNVNSDSGKHTISVYKPSN